MTGPRVYAHYGDHLPDGARKYSLNVMESAREQSQSEALRRDGYRLSRLLWRTGARDFCTSASIPGIDENQLPASGNPQVPGQCFHSSLSHCAGLQVAAFHSGPIGIDAEPEERSTPWQRLAERWFTTEEQRWLQACDCPNKRFLLLWTLKEAWIKASCRGIAGNLQALTLRETSRGVVLRIDQPDPEWRAATTISNGRRISVLWHGAAMPQWFDVSVPGSGECRLHECQWRQLPLHS